jgi:probable HAF family extracellular repeat protein
MNKSRIASTFASLVFAAGVLSSATGTVAAAQSSGSYTIQPVSFPTDPRFTQLLGINDHNVIAGYHGDENTENTPNKGFSLRLPSTFTDENFPNSAQTQVIGINNAETTVGFYVDQQGTTHGFLQKAGDANAQTVDLPGTTFNQLLGINNKDQAAGYFQDAAGLQHAYVHEKNGNFLVLNLPMPSSQATGINDDGDVVGFEQSSPNATTAEGFLRTRDGVKVLQFPGSSFTQALGINKRDEVVGTYTDGNGAMHGFRYRDGAYTSIDVPGGTNTVINGVNDEGWVVGFFVDPRQNDNTIGVVGQPNS